ncbi:pirin family protein [Alteromonas gilva]|uniref:Pirin family protein n=1 Tax=Alteromonas gilva TaxID=2987522 RepID=A0ABT5KZ87_9ALTE|nr:pirin family protein [Alteromonas gilva]MDC8830084.1 pirin family protein [Alteromonas gilva]
MNIRKASERGQVNLGWLQSQHTFSFGHYYDERYMGQGPLRVINQDVVQPGGGFSEHGHANMEIISYVLKGKLAHKDSEGNESVIRPGDVQKMTAGTGIRHSEFNHSKTGVVEFLQIWVVPNQMNVAPGYVQQHFAQLLAPAEAPTLIFSADGSGDSLPVYQDIKVLAGKLADDSPWQYAGNANRIGWLQVVEGRALINGENVSAGDGVAFAAGETVDVSQTTGLHVLYFDLPAK